MIYNKKVLFQSNRLEYEVKIKKRKKWWWLLLLLLLPLLLIRCQHDLDVYCVDSEFETSVEDAQVILSYKEHNLYKDGRFFVTDTISMVQISDSVGIATFQSLKFHVFDYVFWWLGEGILDVEPECYCLKDAKKCYVQYARKAILPLSAVCIELPIKIVDIETNEEIPGAKVGIETDWQPTQHDTLETDPIGQIVLNDMHYCGWLKGISCAAYGYADTIVNQISIRPIADSATPLVIQMRPIKASFSFMVCNAISREPIPQASVEVRLQSRGGTTDTGSAMTNVDGFGKGFHNDGAILSTLTLLASKTHYRDGQFDWSPYDPPYDVDHFTKLADTARVIYLEPEPFVAEFVILDSLTHQPVSGVTNMITITHLDGSQQTTHTEVSNRNGVIPVGALEGETIDIISTKNPEYKRKLSHIGRFVGPDTIYISPDFLSLTFRTVVKGTNNLMPNCNLSIKTQNGTRQDFPQNSGSGVFSINKVMPNDKIFITASKGTQSNSTAINGQSVRYLSNAAQSERDIPMSVEYTFSSSNQGQSSHSYDMGSGPYTFSISWKLCEFCTKITLMDGGNIIATLGYNALTNSLSSGTMVFRANSSNLTVVVTNDNGHLCQYKITRL